VRSHPAIIIRGLHEAVTKLEGAVLAALRSDDRDEVVDARALQLLLRRYQAAALADADLDVTLGQALAIALDRYAADDTVFGRAAWMELFVEASALSDDNRLLEAIGTLASALRRAWDTPPLGQRCAAIGASLYAAALEPFQSTAADAIDQLERVIGRTYEPGEPIGSSSDQVRAASALLVAYALTGRLPYSMLAEELMQHSLIDASIDLATACEGARVLCRLAALHDDADYRAAAIVTPGADYRRDAARLLDTRADEAVQCGANGAIYAIAQLELESGLHNPS
jgi:hypothetical protein